MLSGAGSPTYELASRIEQGHGAHTVRVPSPGRARAAAAAAGRAAPRDLLSLIGAAVGRMPGGRGGQGLLVVYGASSVEQIDRIRKAYPGQAVHMHLSPHAGGPAAPGRPAGATDSPAQSRTAGLNAGAAAARERLFHDADVVVGTRRCRPADVEIKASGWIASRWPARRGYVDVIVGGQYGSEGKGQVAFYLATEYDLLVRVGGPNAGHKVPTDPVFTHHMLPSGTRRGNADLLIGPGAVIDEEKLHKEIAECGVDHERLSIDPNAVLIEKEDKDAEASLVAGIGSTGSGAGSATSRKVMRADGVRRACDARDLRPYVRPAARVMADAIEGGRRVMLEGTQGTSLSVHHGCYPHVTSRETTASGCMADAGVAPGLVRRVIMVTRTHPIRVQSPKDKTSGNMYGETTLEAISKRSGISLEELQKSERTSTTDRPRRIAEFDWEQLRASALLNRPTDIALTFSDYLSVGNRRANRFDQLTGETRHMIGEIERVAAARVSLVAKDFDVRAVLDRRAW